MWHGGKPHAKSPHLCGVRIQIPVTSCTCAKPRSSCIQVHSGLAPAGDTQPAQVPHVRAPPSPPGQHFQTRHRLAGFGSADQAHWKPAQPLSIRWTPAKIKCPHVVQNKLMPVLSWYMPPPPSSHPKVGTLPGFLILTHTPHSVPFLSLLVLACILSSQHTIRPVSPLDSPVVCRIDPTVQRVRDNPNHCLHSATRKE